MPSNKQEYNEFIQAIARSVQYMIDQNRHDTLIYDGIVTGTVGGNTIIRFNGKDYALKQFGTGEINVGNIVKVFVPQGNMTSAFFMTAKASQITPSGEDKTFVYTQTTGAAIWNIEHTLDKFPSITIIDTTGAVILGNIDYISKSNIKVTFDEPVSGTAYLN